MKKIFLCLLLLVSGVLKAQVIENPTFKARNGSIRNITRIERTPQYTKIYIHAIFRPRWWIMEEGDNYLEDAVTGKHYAQTGIEGIELNKKVFMPDSGEMDFVMLFEPLPKEIRSIHLISPGSDEYNTYDISLVPSAPRQKSPLEQVEGNWFTHDAQGRWTYGIHDSIVILNNRFYTTVECKKKGKRLTLIARERTDGSIATLLLTPDKDGSCLIALNGGAARRYVRTRPDTPAVEVDNGYGTEFFRRDSVCLQGYLDGYDPRLGFDSGMLHTEDEIIRKDNPTIVPIRPDGSFRCKFPLQHPICQSLEVKNTYISFYAEPGDTVTLYISWEDVMAYKRARDYSCPLPHTAYMGGTPDLSQLAAGLGTYFNYPYKELEKAKRTLTPRQFQEQLKPVLAQWELRADSLCQFYAPSQKAVTLIRNQIAIQTGMTYFDFQMSRIYRAQQDSTNQVLKVQPDASYYDFLKRMPLNKLSALANPYVNIFINRFEYMEPLNAAYRVHAQTINSDAFKALPKEEKQQLFETKIDEAQDSIINSLCAVRSPLFWQIACVRSLRFSLPKKKRRQDAERLVTRLQQTVTHPYLQAAAREMLEELCPVTEQASYQLPAGEATEIFRRLIAPYAGKLLFVDFWGTTCAPCRAGIQNTAHLREAYRNHPEFQFVYITGESESPEKDYTMYVEKHLKGEACYRLTDTEYKYMRQLFRFNGIPHYVVVEKDGSISTENVGTHELADFLKRRLDSGKQATAPSDDNPHTQP